MAPSCYLNWFWLKINEVLWYSPDNNITVSAQAPIMCEFENKTLKLRPHLPGASELSVTSSNVKHTHKKNPQKNNRISSGATWNVKITIK